MSESSPNHSSNGGADPQVRTQVRSGPPARLNDRIRGSTPPCVNAARYGCTRATPPTWVKPIRCWKRRRKSAPRASMSSSDKCFDPHGRKDTIQKTEGMKTIPRQKIAYRGATFEEMNTQAILDRHPAVCAVDEFAHRNVPGSP